MTAVPVPPEPLALVARVISAVLAKLRAAPSQTVSESSVLQAVRVVASKDVTIHLHSNANTSEKDLLDALLRDALRLLANVEGVLVQVSISNAGERTVSVSRSSALAAVTEHSVAQLVAAQGQDLATVHLALPAASDGQADDDARDLARKDKPAQEQRFISGHEHAQAAYQAILDEPW